MVYIPGFAIICMYVHVCLLPKLMKIKINLECDLELDPDLTSGILTFIIMQIAVHKIILDLFLFCSFRNN